MCHSYLDKYELSSLRPNPCYAGYILKLHRSLGHNTLIMGEWHEGLMAIVLKSGSRVRDPCLRPGHAIVWQNTFLSQYLSPPRSINGYLQIFREA